MIEFSWQAWLTLAVIFCMLVALVRELAQPEAILLAALAALLVAGILTPEQAFAGLSNQAVLSVGALCILSAAIQRTGALRFIHGLMFPRHGKVRGARYRIMLLTASASAFINNTPIVAMFMPQVQGWCEKHKISPSKLMIPLSYASILGGMTTLIGTSTNLLVSGLLQEAGYAPLGLFSMTAVGLPAALVAIFYMMWVGHRMLPVNDQGGSPSEELRNTLFEMRIANNSPLEGSTVEELGLRSLRDAFLVHIRRGTEIVPGAPDRRIYAGDVLSFSGNVAVLQELRVSSEFNAVSETGVAAKPLPLFEAVVAASSALVGKTLSEIAFRRRYGGVVLGIHRRDETIKGSIGHTQIRPGDLLIVEAPAGFDQRWSDQDDEFYLVAPYRGAPTPLREEKAAIALTTFALVIVLAGFGFFPLITAAFIGVLLVISLRCITLGEARKAANIKLLMLIAAALGIGKAVEVTGIADGVASLITGNLSVLGPIGAVASVYIATLVLTELITNNAAAALMLAIGIAIARQLGMPPEAFAITVAIAASASFLSPIGYQTNLMVMSAGGYRFVDYVRTGAPVSLIVGVVTVGMVYWVWL
jgi:di/tricarboxylate transporter